MAGHWQRIRRKRQRQRPRTPGIEPGAGLWLVGRNHHGVLGQVGLAGVVVRRAWLGPGGAEDADAELWVRGETALADERSGFGNFCWEGGLLEGLRRLLFAL